jgi:hypothetical protein
MLEADCIDRYHEVFPIGISDIIFGNETALNITALRASKCYQLFSGHNFGLFVVIGFFQNSRADMVFCNRIAMN